jgi:putative glycosyltransferase
MKLSIVTTLYRSAAYIAEFHARVSAVSKELVGDDYEIVMVNDGSPDDSLGIAVGLTEIDDHVIVVDLSRNFGHHNAMMAGLEQSRGDRIFLIDSDLEEDPEWLTSFSEQMAAEKSDVIYGVQWQRKGRWFERLSGAVFYTLFNWFSDIEHPRNIVTARLMTRRYVDALLTHRERVMVISCLWVITGFKQCSQGVKKHMTSSTTYSFIKKLNHLVNAITSFSAAPLRMIFVCGVLVFFGAIIYAMTLIFLRLFMSQAVDGYTSIMVSIWLLGGMIISFIGIVGIYLSKIFEETKQRPLAIIRDIYGKLRS